MVWLDTVDRAARSGDPVAWVEAIAALEHDWLVPARDAVLCGESEALILLDGAGTRLRFLRRHRWRWWRRAGLLEACNDATED